MVVDSSVLLLILFEESGAEEAVYALERSPKLIMASPTLLETEIVYGSRRGFNLGNVAELVERLGVKLRPFTAEHVLEAKLAYARFGKGQGHPAQLNFGDCVSYALAKTEARALACKGDDFKLTDLTVVTLG
ncbi:type II toxin-antitoxin system VapC family toxin [soil metagenome]|jgi:ribonuclease VapC|nr:type II toxin-antitoxin system VapC family toxin [Deinococcota bacterium]